MYKNVYTGIIHSHFKTILVDRHNNVCQNKNLQRNVTDQDFKTKQLKNP